MRLLAPAVVLLLGAALCSCGDAAAPQAADPAPSRSQTLPAGPVPPTGSPGDGRPGAVPPAKGTVSTAGLVTVLDDGDGAELCLGGVADSLPPQCGGPKLVGWDWQDHQGQYDHRSGVRWGLFAVTGTFDGTSFTATSVIPSASYDAAAPPAQPDEFASPCATPAGGWKPIDPATTTQGTMQRTLDAATRLDGFGADWIDQQPGADNDPLKIVLNVSVTHDLEAAEATLRRTWGGALCVSRATRTDAQLQKVQESLDGTPGMLSSSYGIDGVVDLEVTYDDGSLQDWADQQFGPGAVKVSSALS